MYRSIDMHGDDLGRGTHIPYEQIGPVVAFIAEALVFMRNNNVNQHKGKILSYGLEFDWQHANAIHHYLDNIGDELAVAFPGIHIYSADGHNVFQIRDKMGEPGRGILYLYVEPV